MKKLLRLKGMLFLAAMLLGGVNVWAGEVQLLKWDFNSLTAVPSDWTQANGTLALGVEGDNKYLREETAGSGSRGAWYVGNEIATAVASYDNWTIEFDAKICEGTNTSNYSQGVWILGSDLTQEWGAPKSPLAGVVKGSNQSTYTVYVDAAATSTTVNLVSKTWYHYIYVYDLSTKKLTMTIKSQDLSSTILETTEFDYDYETSAIGNLASIAIQAGRTNSNGNENAGATCIDNIVVSTVSDNDVSVNPTIDLTALNGASRTITVTNNNTAGTLYYTTELLSEAPEVGNDAYTSLEYAQGASVNIVFSTGSGNVYAYAVNGSATSEVVSKEVNCEVITLNAPVITAIGIDGTEDNGYYPVVAVSYDPSGVEFAPAATLTYDLDGTNVTASVANGVYNFTSKGTLTVTASADGYESKSSSYTVNTAYEKTDVINIAGLKEEDVNTTYWTKNENETTDKQWNFKDAVNYSLASEEYIKDGIAGITLWWDAELMPKLYIGKGLMWPYGGANNKDVSYTDGTEDQFVVWTYLNDYGNSLISTITAGNQPYSLYRFSDMLIKVEVYSPISEDPGYLDILKATLNEFIEAYDGKDLSGYTDESAAALTKAIEDAKAAVADPNATEESLMEAYYALAAALEGLEEKPVDEGTWETVGTAILEDPWVLPGLGIDQHKDENKWEVELQRNSENENLYRLVDPYHAEGPVKAYNESEEVGYIVFDVTDPEHVLFAPETKAGFKNRTSDIAIKVNEIYAYNRLTQIYYHHENGAKDLATVIAEYAEDIPFTTFKDGVITLGSITGMYDACFGDSSDPKGLPYGFDWENGADMTGSITLKIDGEEDEEPKEPEIITEDRKWDFTKWSDETVANLKADAAASEKEGWSDVEVLTDNKTGEASKDNCFWAIATPDANGELSANGVLIEELKGLKFTTTYAKNRSLAIAVNYPETALGTYAGPAYLWLGGGSKNIACFTIPGVAAGYTITMTVESHKPTDARGVELYTEMNEKDEVVAATKVGASFKPTTKATNSWTIEEAGDIVVYNTSGCHIYSIAVTAEAPNDDDDDTTGINTVKSEFENGSVFNLQGQKVEKAQKGLYIINGKKVVIK